MPQASSSKSPNTSVGVEKVQTSSKRKNRKKRQNTGKKIEKNAHESHSKNEEIIPESKLTSTMENLNISYEHGSNFSFNRLPWMYSSSSDSEYSDSERSHAAKMNHNQAKVRYCAYKVMQAINWVINERFF